MSISDLLSPTKNKQVLVPVLAESLLRYFEKSSIKVVVAYKSQITTNTCSEKHSHEEADTLIPHQVLAASSADRFIDFNVLCPDTDVFNSLMDLVARDGLPNKNMLSFHSGKKSQPTDIKENVKLHEKRLQSAALIGLHNFSSADWGGKFVGISKNTWVKKFLELDEDDEIVNVLSRLGTLSIPSRLVDGDLPNELKPPERFVCMVYKDMGVYELRKLRWELFRTRNMEGENLPPTRGALLPHIMRVNYVCARDKSYVQRNLRLTSIESSCWKLEESRYMPILCAELPAPKAVLELRKCACKTGCKKGNCS